MKFIERIATIIAIAVIGYLFLWIFGFRFPDHDPSPDPKSTYSRSFIPRQPQVIVKNYSLLPSSTMTIQNRDFRKVEVRSEYPIQVVIGSCFANYTVMWNCEGEPTAVYIKDVRNVPILLTPRANAITVTFTEF